MNVNVSWMVFLMKSLEKLRNKYICTYYEDVARNQQHYDAVQLADEIEKEIEYHYLPKPIYRDGEPVQLSGWVDSAGNIRRVDNITYVRDGLVLVNTTIQDQEYVLRSGDRLDYPDSQERLDSDVAEFIGSYIDIECEDVARAELESFLKRQRRLDGVK